MWSTDSRGQSTSPSAFSTTARSVPSVAASTARTAYVRRPARMSGVRAGTPFPEEVEVVVAHLAGDAERGGIAAQPFVVGGEVGARSQQAQAKGRKDRVPGGLELGDAMEQFLVRQRTGIPFQADDLPGDGLGAGVQLDPEHGLLHLVRRGAVEQDAYGQERGEVAREDGQRRGGALVVRELLPVRVVGGETAAPFGAVVDDVVVDEPVHLQEFQAERGLVQTGTSSLVTSRAAS
ncbi:hypothetical protein VR46_37775 [Streptomyces sp. NRRL S-444]|nr:hypothetical protein VR46_37775 [Streptomyces sp. NRRL S-444]